MKSKVSDNLGWVLSGMLIAIAVACVIYVFYMLKGVDYQAP